jgi:hypothetical protein
MTPHQLKAAMLYIKSDPNIPSRSKVMAITAIENRLKKVGK